MKTLLLASAVFAGLFVCLSAAPSARPGPYHAFCKALWLFASPCTDISTKLVQQIQAYSRLPSCADRHYKLVSATPLSITANHTSPNGAQAENISIKLMPTDGCRVNAQSFSVGSSSVLDNGLNYCNLYNLVADSGLTSDPGFMEVTNEWACLGYVQAPCRA